MGKAIGIRFIAHVAFGFGLYSVAKRIEARGDLAPVAPAGISVERLFYHGFAFFLMACALLLFVRALLGLKRVFDEASEPVTEPGAVPYYPERTEFDPDQVIERYLQAKAGGPGAPSDVLQSKPSKGFGRKQ
jgi:hypothetical protein